MTKSLSIVLLILGLVAPAAQAQGPPPPPPPRPVEPGQPTEERARERQRAIEQQQQQRARRIEEQQRRAEARRGPEYTEPFARTVALGRNGTFELSNPSGAIVVTGGRGNDVMIDAIKRVQHQNEAEARALLQAIEIVVSERSGLVDVRTTFPRTRNWSGGVDYTIALPESANVVIRGVSGDVRLTNIGGELRANTVSGDIVAADVGRLRMLRSVSGDVQITTGEGQELTAGTVSGDLIIRGLKVESAILESVSGDVRLSDVEIGRARLRAISGDLEYRGRLSRGGRYEFESHSGSILVGPVGNGGFDLEASTFSGDLRSDFQLRTGRNPDPDQGRGRRDRAIRGTVGDAGAILTVRSFSGDVTIVRPQ